MNTLLESIGMFGLCTLLAVNAHSQEVDRTFVIPTTNPKATVEQQIASTTVEARYSRPMMRGRKIFGGLVPYGRVWRTGADAATKISFSTPVSVAGKRVEAGDYELFTVPGEDEWIVIIHTDGSQWGSYKYDEANDVARIKTGPIRSNGPMESFTISFDDVSKNSAIMNIAWENVRVPVPIAVDVKETVIPGLEAALQGEGRRPYFQAAMFYFEHDLDITRATELMDKALERNPGHIGMLYRKALILERRGDRPGAIAAAEASLAGTEQVGEELKKEYVKLNSALLDRLRR